MSNVSINRNSVKFDDDEIREWVLEALKPRPQKIKNISHCPCGCGRAIATLASMVQIDGP